MPSNTWQVKIVSTSISDQNLLECKMGTSWRIKGKEVEFADIPEVFETAEGETELKVDDCGQIER